MMASTPGMPAGRLRLASGAAPDAAARPRRAFAAAAAERCRRAPGARSPVSATKPRADARHGAHRRFGALAHRLPLLHRGGIDRDGEKHLAVGDDDVGQRAGCGERLAVGARNLAERGQDIVFGRHVILPAGLMPPNRIYIGPSPSRSTPVETGLAMLTYARAMQVCRCSLISSGIARSRISTAGIYEESIVRFQSDLARQPPPGLRSAASFRIEAVPWLGNHAGYEDWYLLEGSWAMDPLNGFAVTGRTATIPRHRRRTDGGRPRRAVRPCRRRSLAGVCNRRSFGSRARVAFPGRPRSNRFAPVIRRPTSGGGKWCWAQPENLRWRCRAIRRSRFRPAGSRCACGAFVWANNMHSLIRSSDRTRSDPGPPNEGEENGKGRVRRAWRDGLPDGRASEEQGRPRGHGLQPHRRQGAKVGRRNTAAKPRRRRKRPPRARISSWPASATTTTCARSCSARTASLPA